jgi:hypothetical protein
MDCPNSASCGAMHGHQGFIPDELLLLLADLTMTRANSIFDITAWQP